ncbi:MAG TPA: hypothetical protein VFB54_20405 [Burkholderiales bacterium]|nr:hypothetical protein [Burkholderiales bacterium]
MATSSSATAPDGAPSSYRILESFGEQADAIDALLGRAQVSVRVFDTDLAQARWSSAARAQAVGDFLRRSRDARLQIIVHDTRHLESACARLVALLRRYSAAITIYRTGHEARNAADPLLIVDERHFLHRFHADQPRAALAIDEPALAKPLVQRFDEIWMTGEPGLAGDVLGL